MDRALQSLPNDAEILRLMSVVVAHQADYQKALTLIEQSISAMPENGLAHSNRANILRELGRYEDALCSYEHAIRLQPDYAEAYNNKANVLQDLKRYEESLNWYEKAISIDPNYAVAYCNKGNAFEWLGRHDEAIDCFNKAIQINPGHIDAYWQKAMNQLSGGNYELGFQNYEARWSKSDPVTFQYRHLSRLESLQDLEGKSILVWSEQGLGDVIQFCRYIKLLVDKGCKVTFLAPLLILCRMKSLIYFQTMISKRNLANSLRPHQS